MNRKIFILLIYIIFGSAASFGQQHSYSTNFTFSKEDFVDTIPIELHHGQIFVNTYIKGRPYHMCVDTGSGQGTIFYDTSIPDLQEIGNVISHDGAGHLDTVKVVQLPQFSLGQLTIGGYVASMFPSHIKRGYDAILGFDIINKGLCCKIDTKNKMMIITDRKGYFKEEDGYELKYKLKWWVPYVLVSPFKRHVDEVLFDTGSRRLYTMNKQSFDEHAYKSKQVNAQVIARVKGSLAIGNLGAERPTEVAFLKLDRLQWDDFRFTKVNAVTTQGASRIGAEMLNYGSVIIDGFRRRITFQPYNNNDSVEVNNRPYSTAYVPRDGHPMVGLILPGSDDYKAGLRQGDMIIAINGKAISSFEVFQRHVYVKGRTNRLLVRTKEGKNKEVFLKK